MPKLQKRPPPAYPGLSTTTANLEGSLQYESLPQDTRQPIPLNTNNQQAAVSGALGNIRSQPAISQGHTRRAQSEQLATPPLITMDANKGHRASLTTGQIHAPQPQRRSVDLRRLDGRPYEQSKKYMVAQDMHDGELPPAYKRQASDPINPTAVAQAIGDPPRPSSSGHDCAKCGRHRRPSTASQTPHHSCNKCGKQRSTSNATPPTAVPTHTRVVSAQSITALPPMPPAAGAPATGAPTAVAPTRKIVASSPTEAGPSSNPTGHRRCNKCGKPKKPATTPLPQGSFGPSQPPATYSTPLPIQGPSRVTRAGLSITPSSSMPQRGGPQIDVVPPSASTYRPNHRDSAFSTGTQDDTPLVTKASKAEYNHFRNNSIIRSLSRRKSNRSSKDKRASDESPLPSQRASQAEGGDLGAGRLINLISSAIKDSGDKGKPDYQRLSVAEQSSRPSSPFSFMETSPEDQAFEMVPLADRDLTSPISSPGTDIKSPDSITSPRLTVEKLDVPADRRSRSMEVQHNKNESLSVPHDRSRPPITRFKSLREGVSRAASVSRQSSLRRLESLKKVPQFWERDDMALEGSESLAVY